MTVCINAVQTVRPPTIKHMYTLIHKRDRSKNDVAFVALPITDLFKLIYFENFDLFQ